MGESGPPGPPPVRPAGPVSGDGMWWWDGERWQPTELQSTQSRTPTAAPVAVVGTGSRFVVTREVSRALLRISLYGVVAGLVVYSLLAYDLAQLQAENGRLVGQTTTEQQQIEQQREQLVILQATIDDLRQRWIGDPALWQPAGVPSNTTVQYFDVTGTTQTDLIDALDNDGLCSQYRCLPDPAVPASAAAWALELDGYAVPSAQYCYTPRTISYHFAHHVILMPRWSPTLGSVKITLVQEWNALEGAILTHEIGHVNVADAYLVGLNQQSQRQPTCQAMNAFWQNPHLWDGLDAAQNAYHAKLRSDCRPEIGCMPPGWMGW